MKLALIILAVADLQRSKRFYLEALDPTLTVDAPSYVELRFADGMRLGLYLREGFGQNTGLVPMSIPDGALSGTELYFYPTELGEALARLECAGARLLSPLTRRDWGDEAAYYADPDGHVLVLARP